MSNGKEWNEQILERYKVVNGPEGAMASEDHAFQTECFRPQLLSGRQHSVCLVHMFVFPLYSGILF